MINPNDEYIFTVKELNSKVKSLLENNFNQIWISGEISNFSHPSSGHMYFTLKDSNAQIRCAYFRGKQWSLKCLPENGMEVLVCAKLSLYPERGDYQLIVEHVLPAGAGLLQQQFDALKAKLEKAGLFDQSHKKPLPCLIHKLAIITSSTGAALQDVLSVIERRWPLLNITVFDAQVQGDAAPKQLISALKRADQSSFDAILITRGGGSLEDLWHFNDEGLAQTVFNCKTPVVCAVGHEVDFSICDFIADVRAPTPSAAAELLTPELETVQQNIARLASRIAQSVQNRLEQRKANLLQLSKRIQSPLDLLNAKAQHLDFCQHRLQTMIEKTFSLKRHSLDAQLKKLQANEPLVHLEKTRSKLIQMQTQLTHYIQDALQQSKQRFALSAGRLDSISPLNTLKRGYAIAQKEDKTVITEVSQVKAGDSIHIRLSDGAIASTVNSSE